MIWKLIRRNVTSKPFRFLLTCSAVTAGVMFTVGVFVFTDGTREVFAGLAEDIEGDVDLEIRTAVEFGNDFNRPQVDPAVAEIVASVPGIGGVQPRVIKFGIIPIDKNDDGSDGDLQIVEGFGVNIGLNWEDQASNPRLFLVDGAPPNGEEFALDTRAFDGGNFEIGEDYTIQTPTGPVRYELVGTFFFGSETENLLIGDTKQVAFDTATAVEIINNGAGYDGISAAVDPDADRTTVLAALGAALPPGLEIVDGEQLVEEQNDNFDTFVGVFRGILLAFAIIILAVSAFVIYNVFTILIGQRVRELGLLRAIGASGNQVTAALLGEALLVGLASTVLGIALGVGLGAGLGWLLVVLEFGPGESAVVLKPLTFIIGAVVGMVVTLASAVVPSLRARHLSPMAALRDDARLTQVVPPANFLIGVPLVVLSWAILFFGLSLGEWLLIPVFGGVAAFGNAFGMRRLHPLAGRFATLGFGTITIVLSIVLDLDVLELLMLLAVAAVTLFLGVNSLSPALAKPVSHFIGRWPLAMMLGIGGVIITIMGVGALLGSGYLVFISIVDVITDFDGAGLLAVPGSLVLVGIAYLILRLGVRAVDASFIMGWSIGHVIAGIITFAIGGAGAVTGLIGVASIITREWSDVPLIAVGAALLAIAVFIRGRVLPATMKANARMARENAGRSPQRTASAAAALMIGVALVSTATVVTESFKATFADVLDERVISDWFVTHQNTFDPTGSFSSDLAQKMDDLSETESVLSFRFGFEAFRTTFDADVRDATGVPMIESLDHIDPGFIEFDRALSGPEGIWVHEDVAEDSNLVMGQAFSIEFNDGAVEPVRLAGIYEDLFIYGPIVIDLSVWERHFPAGQDQFVSLIMADGVSEDEARVVIEGVTDDFPEVNADTRGEFQERQEGQIDNILQTFTVLLLIAIAIALLGIAITLALSVFERTRELGLVRAVGMTTQQMMRMVLFEGAIIAAFGGFLGVALGTVFGAAAVTVIPDTFISSLALPVGLLVQYLALASVFGIGAAIIPARRAARLNVLDAISQG
jgi:ABC-type antimicrobial peptide transport system permease subunit